MSKQVVGLYSFPKSGNTWLRAIVAGALGVPRGPGWMQKYVTDSHYGKIMENPWEFQGSDWYFYKSHAKYVLEEHMDEKINTDKVIYIYRDPLDVFISYLNFVSKNVTGMAGKQVGFEFDSVEDLTPDQMTKLFTIYTKHGTITPRNKVHGGVFEHIENFKKRQANGEAIHILRYEDLKVDFAGEVTKIFEFLGFKDFDVEAIREDSEIRTKPNGKFFWKRKVGNYKDFLTVEQIAKFRKVHAKALADLGYA